MGIRIGAIDVNRCTQGASLIFGDNAVAQLNQQKRNDCVLVVADGTIKVPVDTTIIVDPDKMDQLAYNNQNMIFP